MLQLFKAELQGNAAVVHFVYHQNVFAFQALRHGVEPLDFLHGITSGVALVVAVIGGGDGVDRNIEEAAQYPRGDKTAAADGDHRIVAGAGRLDFLCQLADGLMNFVVGIPNFFRHFQSFVGSAQRGLSLLRRLRNGRL